MQESEGLLLALHPSDLAAGEMLCTDALLVLIDD